jgi:hypothetical protein
MGLLHDLPRERNYAPDVVPGRKFWHHSAVGSMHIDLAVQRLRAQVGNSIADRLDERHARFIAGRFNAENVHCPSLGGGHVLRHCKDNALEPAH